MTDRQCEFLAKVAFLCAAGWHGLLYPSAIIVSVAWDNSRDRSLASSCSRIPVVSRRFGLGQALQTSTENSLARKGGIMTTDLIGLSMCGIIFLKILRILEALFWITMAVLVAASLAPYLNRSSPVKVEPSIQEIVFWLVLGSAS